MKPNKAAGEMNISVIVPVFREAKTINAFLETVQAVFPGPGHEIIVVDGNPGSDTIAAVDLPQVKTACSEKGRARQMNQGAAMARREILLFLHADTLLPGDAPDLITNLLSGDPDLVGGFSEIPIMEDLELMTRIRKKGHRIHILKQKSVTSSRRWKKEGIAVCTLHNWLIQTLYHLGIPADRLAGYYK